MTGNVKREDESKFIVMKVQCLTGMAVDRF